MRQLQVNYDIDFPDVSVIFTSIIDTTQSRKKTIQNEVKNGYKQNTKQPSNDKQMKKLPKPGDIINYCDDDKDYPKPDDTTNQGTEGPIIDENVCEVDNDCQEDEECVDGKCGRFLNCEMLYSYEKNYINFFCNHNTTHAFMFEFSSL